MLRILLVILVALAVIIGLMTISGGKSGVGGTGAGAPAASDQPATPTDGDAAQISTENEGPSDAVVDVYAEEPAAGDGAEIVDEALPDDLSEGELPADAEEVIEDVGQPAGDAVEESAPNN